jgi:F-type H+-transporting ATPase subunit delta
MQTRKRAARDARTLFRLCLIDGRTDESRVRQVVQQVIAARRAGGLGILSIFQRMVRLDRSRHSAQVISAVPLASDARAGIQAALLKLHGANIATSYADDPALIAGVRITVGSDVYDGSVKGRLAALESRF